MGEEYKNNIVAYIGDAKDKLPLGIVLYDFNAG